MVDSGEVYKVTATREDLECLQNGMSEVMQVVTVTVITCCVYVQNATLYLVSV